MKRIVITTVTALALFTFSCKKENQPHALFIGANNKQYKLDSPADDNLPGKQGHAADTRINRRSNQGRPEFNI